MSHSPYSSFMLRAIELAKQSQWQTAPNPPVGAVLVRDGIIVAEGWHKKAGQPHAEREAIAQAQERHIPLHECTLVVTLEPCNHQGKTPPCSQAIIEAGIPRVVIGMNDPTAQAAGGCHALQGAGIEVIEGVEEQACRDLIDNFMVWQTTELPYTLIKLACTLDGRIATRSGHSQWISSPASREEVHYLRRDMDAVIVGGKTFYEDNPRLTCRLPNEATPQDKQPLAVIVSSRLPDANASFYLLQERPQQTIFWTTGAAAASPKAEALRKLGVTVIGLPVLAQAKKGIGNAWAKLNLQDGMTRLRQEFGCHHVLCEGGGKLALALIKEKLAHELHLHISPKIIADNEAIPLFDGLCPDTIEEALQLRFINVQYNNNDIITRLKLLAPDTKHEGS